MIQKGGMITKMENLEIASDNEIINQCPCDGLNCFNLAKKTIEVTAGTYGKISLQLCEKCMSKFSEKKTEKNMNINPKGVNRT
jgi:hypothetical protein